MERVVATRAQRRARRRRIFWIATGLLALTALAIAAWPARPRHTADVVVHIGTGRQPPATVRFENSAVVHADGVATLIDAIRTRPRLDVALSDTSDTGDAARRHVRDEAQFVRVIAVALGHTTPAAPNASVPVVGPIASRQLDAGRPFERLAFAALLLIFVIIAADALFLTRTRLVSPYARETARERHARRKAERRERKDERAVARRPTPPPPEPAPAPPPKPRSEPKPKPRARPRARPQPQVRQRRRRVDAKPLDLPYIEVHLMDKEGGLRAVELRDAPHESGGRAQQP